MKSVIIDTNVIVSSLIQKSYPYLIIFDLFLEGKIRIYVSDELIEEYFDVLSRPKFQRFPDFAKKAELILTEITMKSVKYTPEIKLDIISDQDDNMILVRQKYIEEKSENSEETKKIDIGFVGEIENINTEIIKVLEKSDYIPVISSIGTDKNGQTYNINADYVAGEIAGKLNADRMIFLTDVDGILLDYHDKQTLIDEIDVYHVNKLIEKGVISGGMLPKVNTCLKAIEKGVENVIILNGKLEHSLLLELFTEEGAGTLIKK